jgi:hypothetical protein
MRMRAQLSDNFWARLCFFILIISSNTSCITTQSRLPTEIASLGKADCTQLTAEKVITDANPVPCERLSQVSFSYLNEHGVICNDGILIVLDILAPKVEALMHKLLQQNFVIAKARPIEAYRGDDQASMADNNSSAFNGRSVTGGSRWSLHAYGAAIDINPVENPFIDISEDGTAIISPSKSAYYAVNRLNHRPGKPRRQGMAEDVVDLFAEHGFFVWGGYWNYPVDYQHFQVGPRSFVEALAAAEREEGEKLLNRFVSMYINCRKTNSSEYDLAKVQAECIDAVLAGMSEFVISTEE